MISIPHHGARPLSNERDPSSYLLERVLVPDLYALPAVVVVLCSLGETNSRVVHRDNQEVGDHKMSHMGLDSPVVAVLPVDKSAEDLGHPVDHIAGTWDNLGEVVLAYSEATIGTRTQVALVVVAGRKMGTLVALVVLGVLLEIAFEKTMGVPLLFHLFRHGSTSSASCLLKVSRSPFPPLQ
jgi:hypothetical protein